MSRFKLLIPATFALAAFLGSVQPVTAGHPGGGGYGHAGHGYYGHGGYWHGHHGYYGGYGLSIGIYPGYPYGGYGYYPGYAVPVVVPVAVPAAVPAVPAVPDPDILPVPKAVDPAATAAPAPRESPSDTAVAAVVNNTARVRVLLPADAQLWLGDELMTPTGGERIFVSPALTPGKAYSYQVKARWTQNGRLVEQSAKVKVYANKTTTVEFRAPKVSEE
jgi:uncharacterized protein (TIGR03000 family)